LNVAFYCVADKRYFLGAVGLINSLRLQGHDEPIFVLDAGLETGQRGVLESHVTLVDAPTGTPPHLLKTIAPVANPAEVMVLIDADMIVTRSLAALIRAAADGRVVAAEDGLDRYVPEWGELLGLGPARPGPYVCSGLVLAGGSPGDELLSLIDAGQKRVVYERTYYGENDPAYPFRFPEQDVLNAILRSRFDPDTLVAIEGRLAVTPPFSGLRVIDERTLRCAFDDGTEPYVLHHHGPKPWLERLYHGVYSRLLRRLLVRDDVAVKPRRGEVPLRLRTGPLAYADRQLANARWLVRWHLRRQPVTSPIEPVT
jgi:hypothetical protein